MSLRCVPTVLQLPRLKVEDLEYRQLQPQYSDLGCCCCGPRTASWVQNSPLRVRHLIAGEAEFEVVASVLGKLYYAFLKQLHIKRQKPEVIMY